MEVCVLNCFNQSSNSSAPTYPQNCTENIEFLQYLDNATSKRIMNSCMWKAFQPKQTNYWSSWECTNNCD
jgi:hypothetical protein